MNNVTVPLSVYVHLPWCVSKCPYCDFNSHALRSDLPEQRYLGALSRDLKASAADCGDRIVSSVFFGGGTPSLFSPGSIGRFLDELSGRLKLAGDAEITLEANPGTIERGRFRGYRDAGINRVSLGAQSFVDEQLKTLGRIHSAGEIGSAVDELKDAGIDNFNLDLMYGLPAQLVSEAVSDVEAALALAPTHLSHYQLTIEPNTLFASNPPELPDDDRCWEIQVQCEALIAAAGFEHYEVSAYSLDGMACRHNTNYWQFGDYLGLGAGAHGKLSVADGIRRDNRCRHPERYMNEPDSMEESRWLSEEDLVFEFMLNALRLEAGFEFELFAARTGLPPDRLRTGIDAALERDLIETDEIGCRLTRTGRRFRDDLIGIFLPAAASTGHLTGR